MLLTSTMLGLIKRAQASLTYVRHGSTIHEWDVSGSCIRPGTRELISRPLTMVGRGWTYRRGSEKAYSLILKVRCRMCDKCRRLKASQWTYRAMREVRDGSRSWFGTLTLDPEAQFQTLTAARCRLAVQGVDFETLTPEQQFTERMVHVGQEVTRWMKRVRKESGAPLRYLLVAEAHKSGEPHLHILMTETDPERPVRYRTLAKQWKLGFTKFNLTVDAKAAMYVCKYISKSVMARVRASIRYGKDKETLSEHSETKCRVHQNAPEKGEHKQYESNFSEKVKCNENEQFNLGGFDTSKPPPTLTDPTGGQNNGIVPSDTKRSSEDGNVRPRLSEADREAPDWCPF